MENLQPVPGHLEPVPGTRSIFDAALVLASSEIGEAIRRRSEEFISAGRSGKERLFTELCFCILTANTSAEMGIRTIEAVGYHNLVSASETELRNLLKGSRYRFYNLRARFIVSSRWIIDDLPGLVKSRDHFGSREYLVDNVMGLGYKEASHFLRNVGVFDFAILDKHILKLITREFGMPSVKPTSRKRYLEIESLFVDRSRQLGFEPGILDLYLWYMATGKILK